VTARALLVQARAEAEVWNPRDITVRTEAEAESRAVAEAELYEGRFLLVVEMTGYLLDVHDYCEIQGEALVRVRTSHRVNDIQHWNDEHLDPYWDVEVIDHPRKANIEHAWIYGRTYVVDETLSPMEQLVEGFLAPTEMP